MTWPSHSPTLNLLLAIGGVIIVGGAVFYATLPWTVQPMLRAMLFPRYRVLISGTEHIPRKGPALLALNHVSWLDGLVIASHAPRRGKAMVNASLVSGPIFRPLALRAGIIPTPWAGPRAIRAALEAARAQLEQDEAIAIFPEGQISRHGLMNPFQRGIEVILKGKEGLPVVPGAVDGLWGSNFSYSGGRFFGKRPKGWRRTVSVVFGPPLPAPVTAFQLQQRVQELLVEAHERLGTSASLPETLDPSLPRWEHPRLGLLTASAPRIEVAAASVNQSAHKPGTVGLAVPGTAIRAVDEEGIPLPPDREGKLEAMVVGHPNWEDTGATGSLDRDGFVRISSSSPAAGIVS